MAPRRPTPTLTEAELKIMKVLWEKGTGTVQDVLEGLGSDDLAYSTVRTMLRILEAKGYAVHEKAGRAFVYRPVVGSSGARQSALEYMLTRFFDGSPSELVSHLLSRDDLDPAEIERVKRLIEEAES